VDTTTPSHAPQPSARGEAMATRCRAANALIAIELGRLPWRTHSARIRELEAAGAIPDEVNFARITSGLRP
jgi:hypothetical protein